MRIKSPLEILNTCNDCYNSPAPFSVKLSEGVHALSPIRCGLARFVSKEGFPKFQEDLLISSCPFYPFCDYSTEDEDPRLNMEENHIS